MGLVTCLVEPGQHVDAALELAESIAQHPQDTTNSDREALLAAKGLHHEAELGRRRLATAVEGARRFAQRK
jgi:enoyl-CoA hydratase